MSERINLFKRIVLFLSAGTWLFFMLALASFHTTDWPSHQVYPYPPVRNLCGSAGSFIAYYLFLAIGQGVFPVLFFSGICLVMYFFKSPVTDLWMRAVGLLLLTVAFS